MFASALQIRPDHHRSAWLRAQRILYRDIRCGGVVFVNSGAVLIIFDNPSLLDWPLPTAFRGDYICIPPGS